MMLDRLLRWLTESDPQEGEQGNHSPEEVLYACGYCDAPVREGKEGGEHPHFGRLCQHCSNSNLGKYWTDDGRAYHIQVCPECGADLEMGMTAFEDDPFAGTIDEGLYGGVTTHSCPNCSYTNTHLSS